MKPALVVITVLGATGCVETVPVRDTVVGAPLAAPFAADRCAVGPSSSNEHDERFESGNVSASYPVYALGCVEGSRIVNAAITAYVGARVRDALSANGQLALKCETIGWVGVYLSVICTEWSYSGGAHPFHASTTLNFAIQGRATRRIELGDLFRDGIDGGELLGRLAEPTLRARGVTITGTIRARDFLLTNEGIVVHFPEYSVGAYIDGVQNVLIPFRELDGLFRPGTPHLGSSHVQAT